MNNHKLFMQILNNNKNIKYNDFAALVSAFGFAYVRSSGSHNIYYHSEIPEMLNIQNWKGEAKPYQVKQFLAMVEKYNLRLEDEE